MVEFVNNKSRQCHNCGGFLEHINEYKKLTRVTSDARPWKSNGTMAVCRDCGLAQAVINNRWINECSKIYKYYDIYRQAGGEEQPIFNNKVSQPRSRKLINWLKKFSVIPQNGRMLDFGCGNGAFLKEFHRRYPKWDLYGTEKNNRNYKKLKIIKKFKKLYLANEKLPKNFFDFISMVHVLEHIPNPSQILRKIQEHAKQNGLFFLQVPNANKNPLSTLIADHASHFTKSTIKNALWNGGLIPLKTIQKWPIDREMSYLCKTEKLKPGKNFQNQKEMWSKKVKKLCAFAKKAKKAAMKSNLVVFGSSIGATWLHAECGGKIRLFLEEDLARVGKKHLKRAVIAWPIKTDKNVSEIWLPSADKRLQKKIQNEKIKIISF